MSFRQIRWTAAWGGVQAERNSKLIGSELENAHGIGRNKRSSVWMEYGKHGQQKLDELFYFILYSSTAMIKSEVHSCFRLCDGHGRCLSTRK